MLTRSDLYPYQVRAEAHILEHQAAMVWVFMGGGKTVATLGALKDLQDRWEISAALAVGPLQVVRSVWEQEIRKWSHLKGLTCSLVHGTEGERKLALAKRADIYLVNYEGLPWLVSWVRSHYLARGKYPPFDAVVYDEVTKVKNAQAIRSEAAQHLLPFMRRRIGLTGEPAANGYKDLHGQYLAVDGGVRLGKTVSAFRDAFLVSKGFQGRQYEVTTYGQEVIKKRVSDVTLVMREEDYLELPPIIDNEILVTLPPKARGIYDQMEENYFAELDAGAEIEVETEATKGVKCLQIAGGAVYLADKSWREVHREKMDALGDLMEEQAGDPVLLAVAHKHEAERILKRFPESRQLSSSLPGKEYTALTDAWDQGNVPLLIGHPKSMGHGLNLQFGGCTLCWFGLNWSLELYNQFNARLAGGHRRRGRVTRHFILAADTMDQVVFAALRSKATAQETLKLAVQTYRERGVAGLRDL